MFEKFTRMKSGLTKKLKLEAKHKMQARKARRTFSESSGTHDLSDEDRLMLEGIRAGNTSVEELREYVAKKKKGNGALKVVQRIIRSED